jgi:hypothetical protein
LGTAPNDLSGAAPGSLLTGPASSLAGLSLLSVHDISNVVRALPVSGVAFGLTEREWAELPAGGLLCAALTFVTGP